MCSVLTCSLQHAASIDIWRGRDVGAGTPVSATRRDSCLFGWDLAKTTNVMSNSSMSLYKSSEKQAIHSTNIVTAKVIMNNEVCFIC
jgi:hypothetical protein